MLKATKESDEVQQYLDRTRTRSDLIRWMRNKKAAAGCPIVGGASRIGASLERPDIFEISSAWIVDTGASRHMTAKKTASHIDDRFRVRMKPLIFETANGKNSAEDGVVTTSHITGSDDLRVYAVDHQELDLLSMGSLEYNHEASFL